MILAYPGVSKTTLRRDIRHLLIPIGGQRSRPSAPLTVLAHIDPGEI